MNADESFPVLGDAVEMLVTQDMTGGASATLIETSPGAAYRINGR